MLRYVVGALVLTSAIYSLYTLSQTWARLADRAIIDPSFAPYRFLLPPLLAAATGVTLLARRKASLVITLLWLADFMYLTVGQGPLMHSSPTFSFTIAIYVALFSFQCLLLMRGLVK